MKRHYRSFWLTGIYLASFASGDETGVIPRAKPSDYPAHEKISATTLAATVVPANRIKKMLSEEIGKSYIAIEVAIYPEHGQTFDVDLLDFSLIVEDQVVHPSRPQDVAIPWPEANDRRNNRGPAVDGEAGVIFSRHQDPVTGRARTNVETWEGVGVSNYPTGADPAPPRRAPTSSDIQERVRQVSLPAISASTPAISASTPIAGYLFFSYNGRKHGSLELAYAKDGVSVRLKLPK
jgi:hypothetical protein